MEVVIIRSSHSGYLKSHLCSAWHTIYGLGILVPFAPIILPAPLPQLSEQDNYRRIPVHLSRGAKLPSEIVPLPQAPPVRKCIDRDHSSKMQVFSPAVSLLYNKPTEDALFPSLWQLPFT